MIERAWWVLASMVVVAVSTGLFSFEFLRGWSAVVGSASIGVTAAVIWRVLVVR